MDCHLPRFPRALVAVVPRRDGVFCRWLPASGLWLSFGEPAFGEPGLDPPPLLSGEDGRWLDGELVWEAPWLEGEFPRPPACFFRALVSCGVGCRWRGGTALAGSMGVDGGDGLGNPVEAVNEPG